MDKLKEILGKILAPVFALFLPIYAIAGEFNPTGNYWWDLLIALGISGALWIYIISFIIKIKKK